LALLIAGASSVMVGRGACWNPSVFRSEGKLFWEDVKREYVKKVSLHKYSLDVVILYVAEC
jgi:tRNA-dihydrouridine synthase